MKPFFHRCALVALSVATLGSARAAYDPALVSADARWVVYGDFNALRESTLGRELVKAIAQAQSQATGGAIGLDIPKLLMTLGSVTAYGTNFANNPEAVDGTLIAQGTADLRKIAESLLLQGTIAEPKTFSEVNDLPFPAYAIGARAPAEATDATTAAPKMELIVAFPPEPIIIVSKSKAQLLKAREVFRGHAPSLAKSGSTELGKLAANAAGAYLFAACQVPGDLVLPPNAPQTRLLQLTSAGAVAFGETGPDTFVHAELRANSEQTAEKLMKILQGLAALLSMAETGDRELGEFLNATVVSREQDSVTLRLAYPSARLAQMAQSLRAQIEARPAARMPQPVGIGTTVAEWGGEGMAATSGEVEMRTIENVPLATGTLVTVARITNGSRNARIDRIEITPADGTGAPLVFRPEFMRNVGRGGMLQLAFPGAPGVYTLKVAYVRDTEGKAKFAVSVSEPKAAPSEPRASHEPRAPESK